MSICLIAPNWSCSILGEDSQLSLFWCFSFTVVVLLIAVVCTWRLHHTTDISPTAHLSKFSQSVSSNQISTLRVKGREKTHSQRLQLFKYCDMWSVAGTKRDCSEWPGYKEWRTGGSTVWPVPDSQTQAQTAASLLCVLLHVMQSCCLWPLTNILTHTKKLHPQLQTIFGSRIII